MFIVMYHKGACNQYIYITYHQKYQISSPSLRYESYRSNADGNISFHVKFLDDTVNIYNIVVI